jgi:meiosis induction protein kinase IME2/SME1
MFGFGKKLVSVFGHQDKPMNLQPVEEMTFASRSTPSLKETPSTSSESRSLPEVSANAFLSYHSIPPPVAVPPPLPPPMDPKKLKKEQERLAREAEKEKRATEERLLQERARAVMEKRNKNAQSRNINFEFQSVTSAKLAANAPPPRPKPKVAKDDPASSFGTVVVPPGVVAANPYGIGEKGNINGLRQQRGLQAVNGAMPPGAYEHRTKRRKEDDDEQSMSSSDVQSVGRMSVISFATVDSDPGPNRSLRRRASAYTGYGLSPRPHGTATSISSLQSFTNSPRSSHSVEPGVRSNNSIDAQFVSDFESRATLAAATGNPLYSPGLHPPQQHIHPQSQHGPNSLVDGMSPPSMQYLTLAGSPNHPPWTLDSTGSVNGDQGSADGNSVSTLGSRRMQHTMVYSQGMSPGHPSNPSYEYFGQSQSRSHPPTPHSVNPAFQVVSASIYLRLELMVAELQIPPVPPLPATSHVPAGNSLPSFSTLISSMGDIGGITEPIPHHQDHPP